MNKIFPENSIKKGIRIEQMIYIIDLKNNKLKLMELKKFLDISTSIIKNNYPEILLKYK